ncbi:non-ribosomal peptide synthetase [Falsiroseomonas tokyonensis]|nr:non-ribosomal peptide synthetase [Falsiroseomonas tokyonensis]
MGAAAVVGLACRLPGAADYTAFAELLMQGRCAITEVPPTRWDWRRHHGDRGADGAGTLPPGTTACRWGGFLERPAESFDHAYFGLSPKEARLMDPQQRLLLEEVVQAMADAGLAPEGLRGPGHRTSVHVGFMAQDHLQALTAAEVPPDGQASLGGTAALLANRVSHAFGLSGESVAVDAACASGLVALHQARRALAAEECDTAIVAGVSLLLSPWRHIAFSQARMLSARGRCATFDAAADGYVPGEGVVVLLLRRPEDARRDGLRVHGLVLGSATGHVGATRTVTAPSLAAQREVIQRAARSAGVGLDSLGYVEAHGTGTPLGDPIEMAALAEAFAEAGAQRGGCLVGSAKTNIGHLEPVAGLVGVAKLLVMLRARRIAPTLHLAEPNPLIDFAEGPFRPALVAEDWQPAAPGLPLRAGVSAFGFGGALAHAILEEAPEPVPQAALAVPEEGWPLLFSAHDANAFDALWQRWRAFAAGPLPPLADLARTLACGRPAQRFRAAVLARDSAGLRQALAAEPAPVAAGTPRVALRLGAQAAAQRALVQDILRALRPCWIEAPAALLPLARSLAAPLRDLDSGRMEGAPRLTTAALGPLRDALVEADAGEADRLLARAATLARGNATFAGYLADWQRALPPEYGALLGGAPRRLALLACVTALARLHEKWQLPPRHQAIGEAWFAAAALVAEGHLTEQAAVAWLAGGSPPLDIPCPDFPLLRRLAEEGAAGGEADVTLLIGGSPGEASERVLPLDAGSRHAVLARLWVAGAAVNWDGLPGRIADAPLPAYPFTPHRHALPMPPRPGAEPDPEAALAAQHVIGGAPLLPAAAMLLRLAARPAPWRLEQVEFRRPVPAAQADGLRRESQGELALRLPDGTTVAVAVETAGHVPAAAPPQAAAGMALDDPYARFAARGHAYGPGLQVLGAAQAGPARLAAALAPAAPLALLDGALQACLLAALQAGLVAAEGPPLLPAAIASVWFGGANAACAEVPRASLRPHPRGFGADVLLRDAAGTVCAELRGVRFVSLAPAEALPLRVLAWQGAPLAAALPRGALVLGGGAEGAGLAALLPGAAWQDAPLAALPPDARDVFVLWPLEAAEATGMLAPLRRLLAEAVAAAVPRHIRLVTQARHAVLPGDQVQAPLAAMVAALGKCAAREGGPALRVTTLDLPARPGPADWLALAQAEDPVLEEVAIRHGGAFAPRLLPAPACATTPVPMQGVQLVVGGAGGLGRLVARRLARPGGRIALLGRSVAPPGLEALLQELHSAGAEACYLPVDIADAAALDACLAGLRARWGRIGRVVQAAMVLADRRLASLSEADFAAALAPKLAGTLNLLAATGQDAARLALFGSALVLRGNAGQANYLAGCAAQDGLAEAAGGRVQVLDWGLWGDAGRVAGRAAGIAAATGLRPIAAEAGLDALEAAMARPEARLVAAHFDSGWDAALAEAPDGWAALAGALPAFPPGAVEVWADRHAAAQLAAGLADAGLLPEGETAEAWRARLAVPLPRLATPAAALPGLLLRQGALRQDADGRLWPMPVEASPMPEEARSWAAAAAPCLAAWPALLRGAAEGAALLVPEGDPARLNALRHDLPADRAWLAALAALVGQARPARLLHLGCGDGLVTQAIAASLPPGAALVAVDRSAAARAAAEARLAGRGLRLLPDAAGEAPFDLMLSLGPTPPAEAAARLAPGGLLLLALRGAVADREIATLGLHAAAWDAPPEATAWQAELAAAGFDRIALAETPQGIFAMARRGDAPPQSREDPMATSPDLLAAVTEAVAAVIEVPVAEVEPGARFIEMGVDSIVAASVADRLRQSLGLRLPVHVFGDHPTPQALADYIARLQPTAPAAPPPPPPQAGGRLAQLIEVLAEVIGVPAAEIEPEAPFAALGIDSVVALRVAELWAPRLGRRLPLHLFGDFPSPLALAQQLETSAAPPTPRPEPALAAPRVLAPPASAGGDAIAITGLSARFPGAADLPALWDLLQSGGSALGAAPPGRWTAAEMAALAPGLDPARLTRGGFLEDAQNFDAGFFGLSPREAMAMDPQQRLLLQEAHNALAEAGLFTAPPALRQRMGVWVGASPGDWALKLALAGGGPDRVSLVGQLGGSLAARLAHHFGMQGPAVTLDAACASAVAALAAASAALRAGEVDAALVGAVAVMATPQMPALAGAAGLLSASGRCAALSAEADGMVLGEGVGALVLRRLEDAVAAGEPIHAVLRAARMGHDGGGGLGIATPSAEGQARLARTVLAAAGTAPGEIGWLEAHGVGTAAGDATELAGAGAALGGRTVPVGSVKPALGHGLAAAGLAALCKVVLQLRHGVLAPTAGLGAAAPELAAAGFVASATAAPWAGARRALVSVFALNGANGMLVVEEAPALPVPPVAEGPQLLVLTAQTEAALDARLAALAEWLRRHPATRMADLARSLAEAAAPLPWRAALVAADAAEALARLKGARTGRAPKRDPGAAALLAKAAQSLLAEARPGDAAPLQAVAELFVAGVAVALPWDAGARRLTLLPGYPFAQDSFWPGAAVAESVAVATPDPLRALLGAVLRMPPERIAADVAPVALGLDSLLALELRQRIAAELGRDVTVAALLAAPDLASLHAAVATAPASAPQAVIVPDAGARHEPFPLTDLQMAYLAGRGAALPLGGPCHSYWEFAVTAEAPALEAALNRLVAAHDMLRAVIDPDGRQRVLPQVPVYRIAVQDWRGLPDAPQRLAALQTEFENLRFDAARWPLFRAEISRTPAGTRLHLAVDLLILDLPSLFGLLGQWAALLRDPAAPLAVPPITFRDCVLAARPAPAAALDFWAAEAPRLPPAPELPGAKALEPGAVWPARRHVTRLAPEAWAALRVQAAAAGVTPVHALLTAFAEVLAHWAVAPRFTLNLTMMDRGAAHPAIGAVPGCFTSTLLLGLDLSAPLPFRARAAAVRDRLGVMLAHAAPGGVRVLRDLAKAQGTRPLMPVVFTSGLGHGEGVDALGPLVGGLTRTPQTWLDAHVHEDAEGGLLACWDAIEALFPDGLIAAMFSEFAALLQRLATAAAWQVDARAAIAAAERARREARNATAAPVPAGLLHEPFLRQALAAPDRLAVVAGDRRLTHGALLAEALAVAAALPQARPNELVAVVLPKGAAQIAAVIGVLLAGGAYLPLDPALPPARLRGLITRGECRAILTDATTEASLGAAWPEGLAIVALDRLGPAPLPTSMPAPRAKPTDLAYVIFTSGSTGEPKGVMIDHRGALNTVADVNDRFGIGPQDRTLALSALNFDLSVWDIFGVLGAGGAVVIPAAGSLADPAHLAGLVARHGVTVWNSVPMFLQLLLEGAPQAEQLASLRLVMLSGDWIPLALPPRFAALNSRAQMISLGGATEASIWSILHPIAAQSQPGWPSVPYGAAMRNQRMLVLDEAMADCADFVPGEIHIGGIGLAQGYWRDPLRSAERFVTHPVTGERLYRTGDMGRWRAEGLIEFLGRRDGQVKLGGHRVELGEVEAALAALPGVTQAVAVAPADAGGRRRLFAFCVGTAGATTLRNGLAQRLPSYMLPTEIRLLPALPRNANDKVDRRALEQLCGPDAPVAVPVAAVATPAARLLAIWRAVLGNAALESDANLFEAGATSFTAVEAAARITREIAACSVTDLFEFPSVAAMAAHLAGSAQAEPDPAAQRAERRRAARALAREPA